MHILIIICFVFAVALCELKVSKAPFIFCSAVTLLEDIHFHSLDFI